MKALTTRRGAFEPGQAISHLRGGLDSPRARVVLSALVAFAIGAGLLLELRTSRRARVMNRTAAFVFLIGDRYDGTITAYVSGEGAAGYRFTSALPVQVFAHGSHASGPLRSTGPSRYYCSPKTRNISRVIPECIRASILLPPRSLIQYRETGDQRDGALSIAVPA